MNFKSKIEKDPDTGALRVVYPHIEIFKEMKFWLEGCLECKEFHWSPDQWDAAKYAVDEADKILKDWEEDERNYHSGT